MRSDKRGNASWQKHGRVRCDHCRGTGYVVSPEWHDMAQNGGQRSYENSLQPGAMSMAERGRRGGTPPLPRIEQGQLVVHRREQGRSR